ncbi:uncharacterized protein [Nicotiana sylvestris]|uniref:uncharacterized protein n=1 Tax=Nicotiana sylvestris TaxID=4096 RepID=UPI00388C9C49
MSGPSFSLFSDSHSLFSRNPSSSHVENTTENVELEGGKGNNINASSVDETPYQSLPDTNSEPVIGGVPVIDKGKCKVVEDSELGGNRREFMPKTETQPEDVDCSDDSQLKKKKIGVAPKKCWDFLMPMDLDYKPKVDWDTNNHIIFQLKENLSKRQLRLFKKICFGYFFNLPPVIVQSRVMHHLLIREVHRKVKNEMRFVVNDSRLRFGLSEFALVIGLKCKGNTSIESIAENRLISKYFGTASVTLAQLADCFKKKKWETNDDALKIAVLYFVNNFLLSQFKTKVISRFWLYECCPSLDGHFADHIGNKLPRILNWVVMGQILNERVALRMSSLQHEQLKNITPTDDEKQLFDVRGLNFEIEVEYTDSQLDSFQVFGTQLPKTQSMHESTRGDSQPTNTEVMKEVQGLKLFVETKFEEVLAAIGRQSMKLEENSAHKQQDNDPDFSEMHNNYDQFERGHVGNDPVAIGDSTLKVPSMSGFGGVGRDGGATGVNVKNITASHGVVNDDLRSGKMLYMFLIVFDLSSDADNAFMCSSSRVDGVGQVDVGGSNVNLHSEFSNLSFMSTPGDLHLDSDFEYTDSQLDLVAAITQGGRRNVNQSGNELTTRAVNKSKPDQSVSRSIVQIQTNFETTPAVFIRRRRPVAVKQSPHRNDWQSGVSAVGGSSKVIKGRFPFVNDISVVVDYKLTTAFSNFVKANMQLGEPLSSSHLNIIFYYLRKKAKYGINMPIKVTTTNTLFNNFIQRVFTEFVKGGKQNHLIDRSDDIMEYMKGFRMYCNTPWHQVDHVLFPINLAEKWHWILGCV